MSQERQDPTINFKRESIYLREEIEKYLIHWKWFLVGVFIALMGAFFYLRYTPKQYEVATTILVNDKENGGLATELSAFQDLGLVSNAKSSIDNEIEMLKSYSLMERVVKELGINVTYYKEGRVITSERYSNQVPIKINFFKKDSAFYKIDTTFSVAIISPTRFNLLNSKGKSVGTHVFGENCTTDFGDITITPTSEKVLTNENVIVQIKPLTKVVEYYLKEVQVAPVNKTASVIKMSLRDKVKSKAQAILDNLIIQHNSDAIEDKSLVARNTNKFIQERLDIISKDLSNVDKGVENFKTANKLTDLAADASLVLQSNSDLEKKILDVSTQLKLASYVIEYLATNKLGLIPGDLGFSDASIGASTLKYNELLLERNRILNSSNKLNPIVLNLNNQLDQLRQSISQSLNNLKASLSISLKDLQKQESVFNSKITAAPKQEREFRDIQRQQQIIETLYLYLLQKREENSITLAVTVSNTKVIDKAHGSDIPVAPKKNIIYLAALLLGLLVPFSIIYSMLLLDNKIHAKKDILSFLPSIPFLGEIPKSEKEERVVISDLDRSATAESFRLLRTNLNFMLSGITSQSKSIFVTSTLSGEGKTFVSINLASVLALSNKKVLLIGADIRKPKLVDYLATYKGKGLTHFLMDKNMGVDQVVDHINELNIDIIHSGVIPPNPSELLMNGRFGLIMDYGKQHYDYVIVDTAPINLVTDTLLINNYADLFIYVVRANYIDKRLMDIPKTMFDEKRLPNMAVLLNSIDYKQGYGYGYGYGYGSGYGDDIVKKIWWKRLFN